MVGSLHVDDNVAPLVVLQCAWHNIYMQLIVCGAGQTHTQTKTHTHTHMIGCLHVKEYVAPFLVL